MSYLCKRVIGKAVYNDKRGEEDILCNQLRANNIHESADKCFWLLEGKECPSGNHHEFVEKRS